MSLTVVALLTLDAVAAHVAEATAGVAGSLAGSSTESTLASSRSTVAAALTPIATTTLGAVARNVSDLAALVALLTAAATTSSTDGSAAVFGALTADVAGGTTPVAGLLGLRRSALAAQVTLLATVVAGGITLGRALGSTMARIPACVEGKQSPIDRTKNRKRGKEENEDV
ncbi:hypothetical protein P154DRAFT_520962 [Amniculicola lignicola CBS 123094]|uniref:Uncharacterized protein n=1 Tax=Amniculicola lignicola CBS 123094 TaxID=1392246 RepID=A0A6A5WXX5_9PLEO|nr:hypothetical protein P154DRAFT_520962 [Amniculicola lignicola CBS 123094]